MTMLTKGGVPLYGRSVSPVKVMVGHENGLQTCNQMAGELRPRIHIYLVAGLNSKSDLLILGPELCGVFNDLFVYWDL